MNEDERPDPHLRAALRHAPDADLQAPAELSARILAAARAAVAADRPLPWWRRIVTLPPLQLGASGAFATLVLAGVIGLLWREGPPEAIPTPAVEAPAAVAPLPAAPAVAPPAEAPPAPAKLARREAESAAVERHARAAPPPVVAGPRESKEETRVEPAPAPAAEVSIAPAAAARDAVAPTPVSPPTPAPSPLPAPAARPALPAPAAAPPPPAAARLAAADNAARQQAAAANAMRAESTRSDLLASRKARADAAPAQWRIDGAAAVAADPRWLRELERIAGPRWHSAPAATSPPAGARRVEFGEGASATLILLGPTQVLWCEGDTAARCRSAEISADELRALADALPPR